MGSSQVQSQNWKQQQTKKQIMKQILFGTECFFFLWQDVGKESSFFDWSMHFFVSMMVMVGFGPVDGRFLTGPNSKMERVAAGNKSCLEQNVFFFFSWQDVGKESSF